MSTTTLTREQQVEIDTKLAELHHTKAQLTARLAGIEMSLHSQNDERAIYVRKHRTYTTPIAETRVQLAAKLAGMLAWHRESAERSLAQHAVLTADIDVTDCEIRDLNEVYRDAPWSRFFLVTSSNGHIHSSMHCSTCTWTTTFGWHPQLSGLTESDAVNELGPILCSVCFPSAPVEWQRSAADVKAESMADLYCTGTTVEGSATTRYGRTNYGTCDTCGTRQVATYTGLRKHRKAK
jgi:hypothetical protein